MDKFMHLKATALRLLPFYGGNGMMAVHQASLVHQQPVNARESETLGAEVEIVSEALTLGEWVKSLTADELDAMIAGFDHLQVGDPRSVVGLFLSESANREEARRVSLDIDVTYTHSGRA